MNPNLSFAFLANYINENDQVGVIVDEGDQEEMISRFTRVGVQQFAGFYSGSIPEEAKIPISTISPEEFVNKKGAIILDVRGPGEYNKTHLKDAINYPLNKL